MVPGGATILVGITAQAHLLVMSLTDIFIFLDFHSTKQGLPLVTKIKYIPIMIHLSNCNPLGIHYNKIKAWWKVA